VFVVWTSSRETLWPCHRTGSRSSSVPASATGVTTARTNMSVQQPAVVCRRHRNIAASSPVLRGEIAAVPSPFCVFYSLWVRSRYSIPDAKPSLRVHGQFRLRPASVPVTVQIFVDVGPVIVPVWRDVSMRPTPTQATCYGTSSSTLTSDLKHHSSALSSNAVHSRRLSIQPTASVV